MSTFGDRMTDAITRRAAKLSGAEQPPKTEKPKDDKSFGEKAKEFFSK